MDIPMYYGWNEYKKVLTQYYQDNAENAPVKYATVAESLEIGQNYVSSMSKWLEKTGFLVREEKGSYRLSAAGQQIAEGINHNRRYETVLRDILLNSDNLVPLVNYLRRNHIMKHKDLVNQILFLARIKRVQSHHKRGIDALIEALVEANILLNTEKGLESIIYDASVDDLDNHIQQSKMSSDKISFLRSAIKLQGQSLLLPTELDRVTIQAKKDNVGRYRPVIAISDPDLNCTYCLEDLNGLDYLRTVVNDKRVELLLEYLRRAIQEGTAGETVFKV